MHQNKIPKNKEKGLLGFRRGMTFVEAIVGIFIFSAVMLGVMTIFTGSFGGYRKAERMAKNIENAQYTMNLLAKSLRTSSIIVPNTEFINGTTLLAYNYSNGECYQITFDNGRILKRSDEATPVGNARNCTADEVGDAVPLTDFQVHVEGSFSGEPSVTPDPVAGTPGSVGKVTIRIKVCSEDTCAGGRNDWSVLQTTVSLRDYATVGL